MTLRELHDRFERMLKLDVAPVAVSFLAAPPAGVRKFSGEAPSGCSFWRIAADAAAGSSAFFTVPGDHYNCPIGSHTHHIPLPANRAHELSDVLGTMSKIGYLKMEEVPKIPVWNDSPGAVVYARLADAPVNPDVVMFATRPGAAMLLGEAAQAAGCAAPHEPLGRPTCMSIPAAAAGGATMSTGCVGNRVYTDLPDTHAYVALRGSDLEKVGAALETILSANETLSGYHRDRKARLTRAS